MIRTSDDRLDIAQKRIDPGKAEKDINLCKLVYNSFNDDWQQPVSGCRGSQGKPDNPMGV